MAENQEQDEDEEDASEPFRGEEALALAREGKDAWNAWAEENAGREVDFSGVDFTTKENEDISFAGLTFPGVVRFTGAKFPDVGFSGATFEGGVWFFSAPFRGATFKGTAEFYMATFEGIAGFDKATFEGDVWFAGALFMKSAFFRETVFEEEAKFISTSFDGGVGFIDTIFEKHAKFTGTTFAGPVGFYSCQFWVVPDFRGTNFQKHVTLHGIEVDFQQHTEKPDADMYRRLKELAFDARDHDRAQEFFAYELKAKRGYETRGLKRVPNYFYGWLSDFGRSLRRPCIGLIGIWFAFGVLYRGLATKDMSNLLDGLLFSTAQLFPFLGASKGALHSAKVALFGSKGVALSLEVNALAIAEGLLGIVFIFLIGLALRNRFRI